MSIIYVFIRSCEITKMLKQFYKCIFCSVALLSSNCKVWGQQAHDLLGKIVDASEKTPLVGAQIYTPSGIGTISDKEGNFKLILTEEQQNLTISYLGYKTKVIGLTPEEKNLGMIELEVSPTSLDEIIVSASSQNFKSDFKGSNFRLTPQLIKNTNPMNTEEVLRIIPGINIVGDMGLSNRPNISMRGSWGRRSKKVLLMEDGSPAAPAPYIAPGAYYNPVSDRLQAIEVYKGADMLRYGPNNMYGGVNYITALPPQLPELRLKFMGGQRGYATGLFSYGGTWNNLGALVESVYKKFDGFTDNSSVELLNLNAKIFAKLSETQSLYFKVSGQYETNQASLSALTPFSFETDPTQNPFDADVFTMRRYGLDIIHKWAAPRSRISLTSKIYASDFERDWWRQVSTVITAADVRNYVGEQIYRQRYSYLDDAQFSENDFVRVGRVINGRESITDSRWVFTVSGLQETLNADWDSWGNSHHFEAGFKLHQESYSDRFIVADSSRWARSGRTTTDLEYYLWSASGFLRSEFNFNKLSITPIVRVEHIQMYRQNLLALSQNPDINSPDEEKHKSAYNVVLPGITASYLSNYGEFYGSIYRGFIAPSKVFGFLVERNGVLTNPLAGENVNIEPELSINTEIGWRGGLFSGVLEGQVAYFRNTIENFVAGGENELFMEPGKMLVRGLETGLNTKLTSRESAHQLSLIVNATFLHSKVLSGALFDRDMFGQVVHSDATKQEFINRVNENRQAYNLFTTDTDGNEVAMNEVNITEDDFHNISKAIVRLGIGNIEDTKAPYTPEISLTTGFDYNYKAFNAGILGNYVGSQYTEFMNFKKESADGAIGRLPSYFTLDAYLNRDISIKGKTVINAFVNGKNLTNHIYKASRLNRAASGLFPGGFRQFIFGINIRI